MLLPMFHLSPLPECRAGCSHAKDKRCSLTCACGVFIFQDWPIQNKNVTFPMSTCVAGVRSSSNLTSHVLVVLQRFLYYWAPWAIAAIKSFARNPRLECLGHVITLLGPLPSIMGYVVAALGTFNPALRSARSDGTCLALERKAWR